MISAAGTPRPPRRSFFIGRWQPLHAGHVAIIRSALAEGREVVVGIMDTPLSARNPYTVAERRVMFREEFERELVLGQLSLLVMPWVDEVCYGRDCGWGVRRIESTPELEAVSGTAIRAGGGG